MPSISSLDVLRLIDAVAVVLSQAYQLARVRLASAASPVLRLICQRDHAHGARELLRRELAILRAQRQQMPPHRRPDYHARQRLAIIQIHRMRAWSIRKTAHRFVLHPNTVRSWIKAAEGRGNVRLFSDAIVWNRTDDLVRWTVHELRRLCPQPELGTRSIARYIVRAGLAISRSTVQRVMREAPPTKPRRPRRPAMSAAIGPPHHLLLPRRPNDLWHLDLSSLRILWFRFTLAAVLDGFSRRLLQLRVYVGTPRQRDMIRLVRRAAHHYGVPRFLITDHGTQFRGRLHAALVRMNIRHVKGRVRAPYLNGKVERVFRTFRIWWTLVLCGLSRPAIQRRLDDYRHWYNHHRPHSALKGLTPDEAWAASSPPEPIHIRSRDPIKPWIEVRRINCRGDPLLPIIQITVNRTA